jgi:hypothetical protein
MANPLAQAKQVLRDYKAKIGGAVAPMGDQMALGQALAERGNTLVNPSIPGAVGAAIPGIKANAVPMAATAGIAGVGGAALGGAAGSAAGAAGAQADMAAQMNAEQQQKFAMAAQEMGKMAVYDPASGTASITPQAIKKALEKINGQGSAEGLTADDYQEVAAMTGLQLDMSGVA